MVGLLSLAAFIIGKGVSLETGRTMAFAVLAFSQLVHAYNVRSSKHSVLIHHPFQNKKLVLATLGSALLMVLVLNIPVLASIFKLTQLDGVHIAIVAGLSLVPLAVVELMKLLRLNSSKDEQ